jgi:hypothetical protein
VPLRDIFRRKQVEVAAPAEAPATPPGALLDGYTEDWHLRGRVQLEGRLLDALDHREPLAIESVEWAPVDGSSGFEPAPGLRTVDPYDLVLVFAGPETMPERTADAASAHRRARGHFGVLLHLPPFRVVGVVHLLPGSEPSSLLDRAAELFLAVTDADAAVGDVRIGPATPTTILANRSYLTRVDQIERAGPRLGDDEEDEAAAEDAPAGKDAQAGEDVSDAAVTADAADAAVTADVVVTADAGGVAPA